MTPVIFFSVRRAQDDVLTQLPAKRRQRITLDMSDAAKVGT